VGIVKQVLPLFALLIVVSAFIGHAHTDKISEHYLTLAPQLPLIILSFTALLGLHYRNSNTFFISIVLVLAYTFWNNTTGITLSDEQALTHACIALLLPLNISFFSIIKDKGVVTPSGLLKSLILIGQVFTVAWLNENYSSPTLQWLNMHWVDIDTSFLPAGQGTLLIWTLSILALMVSSMRSDNNLARAMIGAAIATGITLLGNPLDENTWIFFAAASIILLLSQIQTSYRLAYIDQLTGLPGRRALELILSRLPRRYTIAMLDIDHFKKFNDTYGHDVGDQVLKLVANHVGNIRAGGKAARYGGEEFSIIFPRKSKQDCIDAVEQLRKNIEQSEFLIRSQQRKSANRGKKRTASRKVSVTISIGLCERSAKHKTTESVMKGADQALYRAKKAGRNCVKG